MGEPSVIADFSGDGSVFAHSNNDGCLRLWNTKNSTLSHEFMPSSHLSASATCLSWFKPRYHRQQQQSSGAGGGATNGATDHSWLLALGTCSGSLLVYSAVEGRLLHQLEQRHTGSVRCVTWHCVDGDGSSGGGGAGEGARHRRLLSAGDDGHVTLSAVKSGKVKLSFRAARWPILSMCVLPDGASVLTAARTISWWHLQSQSLLRTFAGHSGDITILTLVPSPSPSHPPTAAATTAATANQLQPQYFISGSATERTVTAWCLSECDGSSQQQQQQSVISSASFSLLAEPRHVHVAAPSLRPAVSGAAAAAADVDVGGGDTCGALFAVTTVTGLLHVFVTRLNGVVKKPIKPRLTVQLAEEGAVPARPLSLLAARLDPLAKCGAISLTVCYGSYLLPTFEHMTFSGDASSSSHCLVRANRAKLANATTTITSTRSAKRPPSDHDSLAHVEQLAPGYMAARKRRASDDDTRSVPMEQRLSSLAIKQPRVHPAGAGAGGTAATSSEQKGGMVRLLIQGLHASDKKMISTVLSSGDERVIADTVSALPTDILLPLIDRLSVVLRFAEDGRVCMKWLRAVVERHAAFFLAQPNLQSVLAPIYSTLQARVRHLPRLMQLRGRLQLLSAQLDSLNDSSDTSSQQLDGSDDLWESSAALQYPDDSTDDEHFGLPCSDNGDDVDDNDQDDDADDDDVLLDDFDEDDGADETEGGGGGGGGRNDDVAMDADHDVDDSDDEEMSDEEDNGEEEVSGGEVCPDGDGDSSGDESISD